MTGSPRDSTVVVFGATSYLGQFVLRELLAADHRVVAVTRNPSASAILLREFQGRIVVCRADDIGEAPHVAAVVNLAYVKSEKPHRLMRQSTSLLRRVHETAMRLRAERLIHASTMAVFGYAFERSPEPVQVPAPASTDSYIESKRAAEHFLTRAARDASYVPAIVRLGNIVGAGSPVWMANLAQRLLEGRSVGVSGSDGWSNATHAANSASYFGHLVACTPARLRSFGPYHHLAELGTLRWSAFVEQMARRMRLSPVLAAAAPVGGQPAIGARVAREVKTLYAGRLGGHARALLARLPLDSLAERLLMTVKSRLVTTGIGHPPIAASDRDLLTILSSAYEFRTHALPEWTPVISSAEALAELDRWLVDARFASADDGDRPRRHTVPT